LDLQTLGDRLDAPTDRASRLFVPRFQRRVQSERAAAPTPWTRRFARKSAVAATGSSRFASRVIAGRPIARRRVAWPPDETACALHASAIDAVRKGGSIIAITSARTARA